MKLPKKKIVIDNWEDMKLFFNETRRDIVNLCSLKPLSIKELSEQLELNPGSIHNHVSKLHKANYITLHKTREINGIIEKKYIKSAEFIAFADLDDEENETRNTFISQLMKKESYKMLSKGDLHSIRINYARLDKKSYQQACKKMQDLIDFLQEKNNSGDINVQMLSCLGRS